MLWLHSVMLNFAFLPLTCDFKNLRTFKHYYGLCALCLNKEAGTHFFMPSHPGWLYQGDTRTQDHTATGSHTQPTCDAHFRAHLVHVDSERVIMINLKCTLLWSFYFLDSEVQDHKVPTVVPWWQHEDGTLWMDHHCLRWGWPPLFCWRPGSAVCTCEQCGTVVPTSVCPL